MKQKKVATRKATKTTKATKKRPAVFSGSTGGPPVVERSREERLRAALGVMAKAIHAQGEREADYTERLNKMYGR
jgi:hypothetical protein